VRADRRKLALDGPLNHLAVMNTTTLAATAPPLPAPRDPRLRRMADALRVLAMDAVEQAKSGHPGMPMGMADIAAVLFTQFLRFDPLAPEWPDRDRFVVSNGHGCMLLYGLLHLTGYPDMTLDELKRFRQLGSRTAGHPERGHASGIEVTTGPLGQGLGNSVGMALAERLLAAEFGDEVVDHHTYVFAGDGCLMEGISHEAASLAGHLGLNKLIVFYDDNSVSIDGPTELAFSDDPLLRFRGYGWAAERIDGQDHRPRGEVELDPMLLRIDERPCGLNRGADQRLEIDLLHFQVEAAPGDSRHLEQIVEQQGHSLHLTR